MMFSREITDPFFVYRQPRLNEWSVYHCSHPDVAQVQIIKFILKL